MVVSAFWRSYSPSFFYWDPAQRKSFPACVSHGGSRSLGPDRREDASVSSPITDWLPLLGLGLTISASHTFTRASNLLKTRLAQATQPLNSELQQVLVRTSPRHSIPRIAHLRQAKGRWYTTHSTINAAIRRFVSNGKFFLSLSSEAHVCEWSDLSLAGPAHAIKFNRASFPPSATARALSRLTSRAPFASTLRPNLTGGTLSRTSGGYSLGGGRVNGARYFSHTPAAPAQVFNNVSVAVRAFLVSGQKAQFDGFTPAGEKRYRSVTSLQDETAWKIQPVAVKAPGSFIDFSKHILLFVEIWAALGIDLFFSGITPTVTALTPHGTAFPFGSTMEQSAPHLNMEGFLDVLSVDFSRAFMDLVATVNDLKRLSSLGDLPIVLEESSILRVRFPGCDLDTVERLCDEVGVQRGIIKQDPDFDRTTSSHMALMFPLASTSEHTQSSPGGSLRSQSDNDYEEIENMADLEGYETMEDASESASAYFKPKNMCIG